MLLSHVESQERALESEARHLRVNHGTKGGRMPNGAARQAFTTGHLIMLTTDLVGHHTRP